MSAVFDIAPALAAAACASAAMGIRGSTRGPGGWMPRTDADRPTPPPRGGRRFARARRRAIHDEIPQLLDLLAAGSTAGLSAELSFRQASECLRGPLGEDLARIIRSIDLGIPWRQALHGYVEATGDPDLARMLSVLARTETLGVPLSEATRELAASVREARRTATLGRARTAPVKMLFPLVFLILPAFLLLTVVPVLITTVRSIN